MAKWTADLHFGHGNILEYEERPYKTAADMNHKLIARLNSQIKDDQEPVRHLGDFACYGKARGVEGMRVNPREYLRQLKGRWTLIKGNHDGNNKVKCAGEGMIVRIGSYAVFACHYPSYHVWADNKPIFPMIDRSKIDAWICGHVHRKWKTEVVEGLLNINVGLDAWNMNLVDDNQIVQLIDKHRKEQA